MARTRTIQNSFNAGEWSPLLEGRTDLAKYHNACRTLTNMICLKQGGAQRRPGTRFVAETKSSGVTRLLPFEFSTTQAYVLELTNVFMRFYKTGARIESPPGTPVQIATPYLTAELFDIHFAQSADVLYLAHENHPPQKLSRTSDTSWTIAPITFQDGPYLAERIDITITPSATTGTGITLTASAPLFQANPLHVGSIWRLKHGTTWGYARITTVTNSTTATADVVVDFGDVTASDAFREGAWSGYRGYPRAVTLFQQRLWWAGSTNDPDTVWGSQTSDYENMSPGTALDNEAVTFTLASNRVNAIEWIAPSRVFLAGTTGQEWQVFGASTSDPITPASTNARAETTFGSNLVSPVQVHNAVLFLQRSGRRIREFTYEFSTDSYVGPDMTILAEHITAGGITQMDYQQERDSVLWAVRGDGALLGLTYERDQDVEAWHKHFTGGAQDLTDGKFESIAVIPDDDEDQAWVVVNRTIGGVTKRYVEYLDTRHGYYTYLNVDSAVVYSGAATDTISGLSHLEGQSVDILGNGCVYPAQTVTSGQVAGLSPKVTVAEVGLHFGSTLETERPEAGADSGTAQAAQKRNSQIIVRLYQSLGVTINNETIPFRRSGDNMNQPVPLFTGDKKMTNIGWDSDAIVRIRQTQPLPLTVLAIIGVLTVGESNASN